MRAATAAILVAVAVAGCISPEEQRRRQAAAAEAQEQADRAYTENLKRQCDAVGYARDTEGHRQCVLQLHAQAQGNAAAARNIILQQYLQNQTRQPVQTNCRRDFLGNVRCTTY